MRLVRERDVVPRIESGPYKKPTGMQHLLDLDAILVTVLKGIHTRRLTPCISLAPEYDRPILVFWRSEYIMELHSKAVQVPNVQWSKIMVECIVEEGIIDREVTWWRAVSLRNDRWPIDGSRRALTWRTTSRRVRVWEESVCRRWGGIRC